MVQDKEASEDGTRKEEDPAKRSHSVKAIAAKLAVMKKNIGAEGTAGAGLEHEGQG